MGVKVEIPTGSPFTIQNIPFRIISTKDNPTPHCATAIGSYENDPLIYSQDVHLNKLSLQTSFENLLNQPVLNTFAALPHDLRKNVRDTIIQDINNARVEEQCLIPLSQITVHLPMHMSGYSDFHCSLEHCQSCSPMAAGAVIPKYSFYAPSVYNSRVSSVIPSAQPVRRPRGMFLKDGDTPTCGPSQELDYDLEIGCFVSKLVPFSFELNIAEADEPIFEFVLLNDWSARDLQMFKMKPLGPFHAKDESSII
ncbi:fumarylacetoacetate hydrolase [Phlyctema vagabunda]|uniref:Fumarylacetoacetase n=1 Tax=Phlyctema vagabunda TaxID=108571 RepID=A0ABR4PLD7_9HELO